MTGPVGRFSTDIVGRRLEDRFEVTSLLARGGMASVFLGTDHRLGERVVVKVPLPEVLLMPGFRERFHAELRELLSLRHPHVVRALSQGEIDEIPYFILEYLEGGSLSTQLKAMPDERARPSQVIEWLPDIARTLDFIHGQNVIHRDVKPGNILFDRHGHVFLSDFGIAKVMGGTQVGLTATSGPLGSPAYMAPEQINPDLPPSGRMDQYALAATLYHALSGRPPYKASTSIAAMIEKQQRDPKPLRDVTPGISEAVEAVINRGMSREPAQRYPSCVALSKAFDEATRTRDPATSTQRPPPRKTRVAPVTPRRSKHLVQLAALGVMVGLVVFAAWLSFSGSKSTDSDTADAGPAAPEVASTAGDQPNRVKPKPGPTTPEKPAPPPKDVTPPLIVLRSPAEPLQRIETGGILVEGSTRDASAVHVDVRLDGTLLVALDVPADGNFRYEVPRAEVGAHVLTVVAVDAAGNRSEPLRRDVEFVDLTPAWDENLARAAAAGSGEDWRRAEQELGRARTAGLPRAEVPAWIEAGIKRWNAKPTLEIWSPGAGAVVKGDKVEVRGWLRTGRKGEEIKVGDSVATRSGAAFHAQLRIRRYGKQTLRVVVRDGTEVRATKSVTFTLAHEVPVWARVAQVQRDAAETLGIPVAFETSLGMRFVLIPAGKFPMGHAKTKDRRTVTLTKAYYLQVAETTNTEYMSFKGDHEPPDGQAVEDHPATNVSYDAAKAFATWLSARARGPAGQKLTYRLPTEAEWERASRAGTETAYAFGDDIDGTVARYSGDGSAESTKVRSVMSYEPNTWGLFDTHGNVNEWVADYSAKADVSDTVDPHGPTTGDTRVYKGGCFL